MNKLQLRRHFKDILLGLTDIQKRKKSSLACQNLVASKQFQDARVIMMFLSLPDEIDTAEAVNCAWQQGREVVVPKVFWKKKNMSAVKINSLVDGFTTAAAGLRNPLSNVFVAVESIDLIVTPGLVFDKNGYRLGRGGGFYDKFFAEPGLKAVKCGLAFDEQLLRDGFLPAEQNDIRMDMLVTDKKVFFLTDS